MSFGRQKQALVLLINDSGLQLFAWRNATLAWQQSFRATPSELEAFDAALDPFEDWPAVVVSDLIEESFRHDTAVHVTGSDHAAIMKRKLDFVFRGTAYRLAKVIDRESTGRRDDRIMLSAITKPDLVDIWVRVLLERRMAIQSVTSVAHLLHDFAMIEKIDQDEYLLIINIEPGGNLRQTFVRKGVVMFSRLTPVQARETMLLGGDVLQETLQLRQYFERIQFVPYEATMRIRVYSAFDDAYLQLESRSAEMNRFEVVHIDPQLSELGVDPGAQEVSPVHYFIAKVLAGRQPANVYAPPAATKYQDLRRFGRMLWYTTATIMVLGVAVCIPPALSVLEQWKERDALLAQARPLEDEYRMLTERFPETPIPSREMQLVVETHDLIAKQIHSPVDALNMISRALTEASGLQLTSVTWELAERAVQSDTQSNTGRRPTPREALLDGAGPIGLVLRDRTAVKVTISGEAFSPASFREAQQQVNDLIAALRMNPGVTVFASQMPTEIRTDVSFSTTVDDREVRGPFTLELTFLPEPPRVAMEDAR
ncbi:MAG: hypothetical protein SV422_04025 [Pseudomonadota bacterium]|nr:hypothetical protein [Pseudomonadota bacterium]